MDMETEIAALVAEKLEPLGGKYRDRYWPITPEQATQVEETVGFALPADYRAYIMSTGVGRAKYGLLFSPTTLTYQIAPNVLFGHRRRSSAYSVVDHAGLYLGPPPLLKIGVTDSGAVYLDQAGTVLHENNKTAGVTPVADSFLEFLAGFELDEHELFA